MIKKRAKPALNTPRQLVPGGHLLALLKDPPRQSPIYTAYNRLRQHYIVAQTMRHFGAREDDPAHLYQKTLLDVGCGEAPIAEFLALAGAEITAIDPNPAALATARASAEAFGAPITFMNARAEDMLKHGKKYDVILALDLLEVSANPQKTLWVLRQLLAEGGVIVFSAITRSWWAWVVHVFLSSYMYQRLPAENRKYERFFTPLQLGALLKPLGLGFADVTLLRFSSTRKRWIGTHPHSRRATRYLAAVRAE